MVAMLSFSPMMPLRTRRSSCKTQCSAATHQHQQHSVANGSTYTIMARRRLSMHEAGFLSKPVKAHLHVAAHTQQQAQVDAQRPHICARLAAAASPGEGGGRLGGVAPYKSRQRPQPCSECGIW